jgi:DNA-binding NarL/FixJ family response regulator
MKLRILIADDHEVVRRGLCMLLETHMVGKSAARLMTAAKPSKWPNS